jgi:hypothetical protein
MEWDVFISHASEDKDDFVRPLADHLQQSGLRVGSMNSRLLLETACGNRSTGDSPSLGLASS